jgi:hypothetical protein
MWRDIEEYFEGYPSQKKVALYLLRRGFQVGEDGRIRSGGVAIPHAQIAKELDIDRRTVDTAARRILKKPRLRKIYRSLQTIAYLGDTARHLNLGVVIISVDDASRPGIIGAVASKIAEHGIAIRQAIADDPYLTDDPKFTVIADGKIPGELIDDLKKIEGVKNITIY